MNDVQSLIDRQLGIFCRLNYDNVLKRLVVNSEESFYGLQSANAIPNFDQDPPIFACRFAEVAGYEHILALANEDGRVAIQDTTSVKTASALESFQCHNNAVFDLAWMPGHTSFVTVSGDHSACLWDLGTGGPRRVALLSSHTRSVKCAAFQPGAGAALATGARDGNVLVWDLRAALPVAVLRPDSGLPAAVLRPDNRLPACHAGVAPKTPGSHGKRARLEAARAISITGLVFRDEHALLSCAECDGNIKVWDLRKNYSAFTREPLPRHAIPYCGSSTRVGYTNLALDAARAALYASCMDGVIYRFNVAAEGAQPERRYAGHESGTFYIKAGLSADGEYLVSGSSDKLAYVWSVRRAEPLVRLAGHRAEVTCAAWAPRGDTALVTCGDDARHLIWRVGPERPPPGAALLGRAEPAPAPPALPEWGTPSSAKRARRSPPPERGPRRKGKRCLAAMLGAPPDAEPAPKRARATERGPGKRAREASPPPAAAPPPPSTPSPAKVRVVSFSPPTRDLPDFVRSGEAPHLRLMSPAKKKPETEDWLTRLVRERRAALPAPAPAPPPAPPPPQPLSPKENVPPRRISVSEKTPRSGKKGITLFNYFTVADKKK